MKGSSRQGRHLKRAAGRCEAVVRPAELALELPGGREVPRDGG
ncbi:hypothetical protein [Desulfovirgula thermocuniculi]|nr:hypothetical protein [Desulfovirgula thermocuniculi]